MRGSEPTATDTHDDCWSLLPWHVTGRLSATNSQRVERHLVTCAECRAELEQQRFVCDEIRRDDSLMLAPQASLQKLMARIDAGVPLSTDEFAASETASTAIPTAAQPTRSAPRWLAIAAAVQTLAIGVLLTMVWQRNDAQLHEPRFTTLSTNTAAAVDGPVLRVVFQPDMTAAQVKTLLVRIEANVVAGPTEAGVYTVSLGSNASEQRIAQALAAVRADQNVKFAELSNPTRP